MQTEPSLHEIFFKIASLGFKWRMQGKKGGALSQGRILHKPTLRWMRHTLTPGSCAQETTGQRCTHADLLSEHPRPAPAPGSLHRHTA